MSRFFRLTSLVTRAHFWDGERWNSPEPVARFNNIPQSPRTDLYCNLIVRVLKERVAVFEKMLLWSFKILTFLIDIIWHVYILYFVFVFYFKFVLIAGDQLKLNRDIYIYIYIGFSLFKQSFKASGVLKLLHSLCRASFQFWQKLYQ